VDFCTNFYVCNRQIKDVTIFIFSKHTASEDSLFILIIILFRQSMIQYLLSFLMSNTLLSAYKCRVAQKTSRTFACIIQPSGENELVQKHICSDQTSPNMCRNFRLKHFCISRDTNKIASHAIKHFLQAAYHLRCRLYAGMPKRHSRPNHHSLYDQQKMC